MRPNTARALRPVHRKIGVLTFHRCINYGSYWQARCLVESLLAAGHDAELLDHWSPAIARAEWRCAMQPLLPTRSPRTETRKYSRKTRRFQHAIDAMPLSARFPLERPEQLEAYDIIVVGSDEVWNLNHPWYGAHELFFGKGLPARQLVSYAASFGNYDAEGGIAPHWSEHLRRFAAISVRDENSRRLVRAATGAEPALVLDPCLQFPPAVGTMEEPEVVAVYGHSFSARMGKAIRAWADRRGRHLLSIGYRNEWAHEQWLDADPLDFARLIASSAAVVTNFFHGSIFALLNAKPFACVASPYRMNKLAGLTEAVGAEGHLLRGGDEHRLDTLLETPLSEHIGDKIGHLRRKSADFLAGALA